MAAKDTGHGASITFSGGFAADIKMIEPPEFSIPALDITHLGTTGSYMQKVAGDLQDLSEVEFDFFFNPQTRPTIGGTAQTITITFPVPSGLTTGATLAGTGFLTKWKPQGLKTNEMMMAKGSIQFDGVTGPTWTSAS